MWDWFVNFLTQVLAFIHNLCGDWGLAVIILTVIIRIALTPLTNHSTRAMVRSQMVQPKLNEIKEKYANDPVRQNEEMRKIMSESGANPLSGCLPILLQMPVFFALFAVAKNVPSDASFYGILPKIAESASAMMAQGWLVALPYLVFVIGFGAITMLTSLLNLQNSTPETRQQMIIMGVVMAGMMIWFGWSVPAAVLLYYVASGLWQVVQQLVVTRKIQAKERAKMEAKLAGQPQGLQIEVVRKERKPRPKKSSK